MKTTYLHALVYATVEELGYSGIPDVAQHAGVSFAEAFDALRDLERAGVLRAIPTHDPETEELIAWEAPGYVTFNDDPALWRTNYTAEQWIALNTTATELLTIGVPVLNDRRDPGFALIIGDTVVEVA